MNRTLIEKLEDERFQSLVEKRYQDFSDLVHDDLIYTHTTGVTDTKSSYLNKLMEGFYDYKWVEHPIMKIEIIGDLALVFGEMNSELIAGNTHKILKNKSIAIWKKEGGQWLFYAYQPTPLS